MELENLMQFDAAVFSRAKTTIRAIDHPLRQQILALIHKNGRIRATGIYTTLKLEQSVASLHLGILRNASFVNCERVSKYYFYSVNYERINEVNLFCKRIVT